MNNLNIAPPILQSTYDGFRFAGDGGESVLISLPASVSVMNTTDDIDHIQVRIHSLDSNTSGLNKNIFPQGIYFIKFKPEMVVQNGRKKNFNIQMNSIVGGQNIFSTPNQTAFPAYYRMQIRIKRKGDFDYNESEGQNPNSLWHTGAQPYLSEWSNSSIIKTTVKPSVQIEGLSSSDETILKIPDYIFQGTFKSNDPLESLVSYRFKLYANGILTEEGPEVFIKEYELISMQHIFDTSFQNDIDYVIEVETKTTSNYVYKTSFRVKFDLSYTKLYNIIRVNEDKEAAANIISISGRQVQLVPTPPELLENWLSDESMEEVGETGVTHYRISSGNVSTPTDFDIPYDNFTIAYSFTGFQTKAVSKFMDAFKPENLIISIKGVRVEFTLGLIRRDVNKYEFVVRERPVGMENAGVQYYSHIHNGTIGANTEFLMLIKKDLADTVVEITQWLTNSFV